MIVRRAAGFYKTYLEFLGFGITIAKNGQEAIKNVQSERFDFVITNLVIPVMNGFKFLRQICSTPELAQTKAMTASASLTDQNMPPDRGNNVFLTKLIDTKRSFLLLAEHLNIQWVYKKHRQASSNTSPSKLILLSQNDSSVALGFSPYRQYNSTQKQT